MQKKIDLVLPIYNQATYVSDCINSILNNSRKDLYNLYLVNDCSDNFTHCFLKDLSIKYPQIFLRHNSSNLGFIKSCNLGISLGNAPYIALVNSDVIVTPSWLSRLLKCAESDPRIATVNPLTNYASNINIPIAPGANFYSMDAILAQYSPCNYPDVVTGVGFCILLRRSALEDVGLFDEVYGRGYCEESDLCMRLTTKGYRTVVADNVYVYHKGKASFKDRDIRYQKNRQIFDARWSEEYKQQFRDFLKKNPLKPVRNLFRVPQQQPDQIQSMRETYRAMRHHWHQHNWFGVAREAIHGVRRLPEAKRDIITSEFINKVTRTGHLRVTYVLPGIGISGGILSVIQLVNELILLGVEARIVAPSIQPEVDNWKFLTQPIITRNITELINNFPESDIVVATFWTTAPWVADIIKSGKAKVGVYFIQDYESWFYPESDQCRRIQVKATYPLISRKIVKSNWLANLLIQDGYYDITKVRLGMDLSLFYPRDINKTSRPTVVAMARPKTPRRGFYHVIKALQLVKQVVPEVEIILFGDKKLKAYSIPFEFRNEGIVSDRDKLAELYSTADVFLDGSDFQGFGRTALEAMACGTACVLTNVGGVNEYAVDRENCLLVPPQQPEVFAKAVTEILRDNNLKSLLIKNGLKTVKDYCHKREAQETLNYFSEIQNLLQRNSQPQLQNGVALTNATELNYPLRTERR